MSIKKLAGDFAFYGLIDLVQRSISLLLVPLYTRILDINDYGKLDMLIIILSALSVLVDFQFISGISRLYLECVSQNIGNRFMGTVLSFRFLIGLLLSFILLILGFSGFLEINFLPSFTENRLAWILILFSVPVSLTFDAILMQARMLRAKIPFALGALISTLFTSIGSLIAILWLDWGIVGVLTAMLAGKVIGFILLFLGLKRKIKLCLDKIHLHSLFSYCLPLVPGWWFGFSSTYISRFFIYGTLGPQENAILAVSMKIQNLIGLFAISYRSAWLPIAMSYIKNKEGDQFYISSMRLFMSGGFLATLCLTLFIQPVLSIFAPDTYSIVGVGFAFFSVGCIIGECESNLQLGLQITKKTIWITLGSIVSFFLSVSILFLFTNTLGVKAAGIALLCSAFGRFILTYYSSQHFRYIFYDLKSFAFFFAGCSFLLINDKLVQIINMPQLIWSVILLIIGFFISFNILDKAEIYSVRNLFFRLSQKVKFREE